VREKEQQGEGVEGGREVGREVGREGGGGEEVGAMEVEKERGINRIQFLNKRGGREGKRERECVAACRIHHKRTRKEGGV